MTVQLPGVEQGVGGFRGWGGFGSWRRGGTRQKKAVLGIGLRGDWAGEIGWFTGVAIRERARRTRIRGANWHSDAALDMMDVAFSEATHKSVQQRAARDGTAHNADTSARFFFK